jgi:hypothetical protein
MGTTSPTARSLALLRRRGYAAEKVEQRLPRGFVTRDLFGCIDLVACRPGEIVGIQTTSRSNLAARRTKALGCPGLVAWLQAGGRFVLHGWGKVGARGFRKTWQVSEQWLTLADVVPDAAVACVGRTAAGESTLRRDDAPAAIIDDLKGM